MAVTMHPLPSGTATCSVHVLNTSQLILRTSTWTSRSSPSVPFPEPEVILDPSFCFLLQHRETGKKVLFDLGVRKDWREWYNKERVEGMETFDTKVEEDVADVLAKGGISPDSIDIVILSHGHWDHTGDPSRFPSAKLLVGKGTSSAMLARDADDSYIPSRAEEVELDNGKGVGAYEGGHDVFGDGSVVMCHAPGHLEGHTALLVRTTAEPATYVCLGGDTCHHFLLPSPTCPPGLDVPSYGYSDQRTASVSLRSFRAMEARDDVMCIVAHDAGYWNVWKEQGVLGIKGEGIGEWKRDGRKLKREDMVDKVPDGAKKAS